MTGTIVGIYGQVYRTTDGGSSWLPLTQGSRLALYGADFADPSHGIVVGSRGTVLRTTNGGTTWLPVPTTKSVELQAVAFSRPGTATIAGWSNTILRTTDGGATWTDHSFPNLSTRTYSFSSVAYSPYNSQIGFVAGKMDTTISPTVAQTRGMIYRTGDGGITWSRVRFNFEGWPQMWLHAIAFIDSHVVISVGPHPTQAGGAFWASYDVGRLWSMVFVSAQEPFAVSFNKTGMGLAVGDRGSIWKSVDRGGTWEPRESGVTVPLRAVKVFDQNVAMAVGDSLTILKSVDGGNNWTIQSTGIDLSLNGMAFWDKIQGVIVGNGGSILSTSPVVSSVENRAGGGAIVPAEYSLLQNYPNPFNPKTVISYKLLANSFVNLRVFDALGREVALIASGVRQAGTHTIQWNAGSLPSGVYFCRLMISDVMNRSDLRFQQSKPMLLMK
jgi:photosystem II stability/assembly factor-like uncharacterized protein